MLDQLDKLEGGNILELLSFHSLVSLTLTVSNKEQGKTVENKKGTSYSYSSNHGWTFMWGESFSRQRVFHEKSFNCKDILKEHTRTHTSPVIKYIETVVLLLFLK